MKTPFLVAAAVSITVAACGGDSSGGVSLTGGTAAGGGSTLGHNAAKEQQLLALAESVEAGRRELRTRNDQLQAEATRIEKDRAEFTRSQVIIVAGLLLAILAAIPKVVTLRDDRRLKRLQIREKELDLQDRARASKKANLSPSATEDTTTD